MTPDIPDLPPDESERLAALRRLEIVDTLPEQSYDDLTLLASQICGAPIAMLTLIDAERQWNKSMVGTAIREVARDAAFCARTILEPDAIFTVADATVDPRFADNPYVTDEPPVRFYAGAPVVMTGGHAVGALCVMDTRPRTLTAPQRDCLAALARQASALLDLREDARASERLAREHEQLSVEAQLKQKRGMELLDLVLRGGQMGLWDLHVPSGVWTVNAREQLMLGYGGVLASAGSLDWRSLVHPDDWPLLDDAMEPHLNGRAAFYEATHRMRHADGHYLWVLHRGVIVERDVRGAALRIVGTHVDVTDSKRAEERLSASEQRLRGITDNIPVLIAEIDPDGRFRFVNQTYRTWLALDPTRMIGERVGDAIGDAWFASRREYLLRACSGEKVSFEMSVALPAGQRCLQTTYLPHFDAAGAVAGVYALTSDITELKDIQRKLDTLARCDPLTGLANRMQLEEEIVAAMARSRRTGAALAVLYFDVDRFKSINDVHGHAGGDAVLVEFGRRLQDGIRETDLVGRQAGDEFIVILEGVADEGEAQAVADKLVAAMRPPFTILGKPVCVTTSVGVAVFGGEAMEIATLLSRADRALYDAKAGGRDRVAVSLVS